MIKLLHSSRRRFLPLLPSLATSPNFVIIMIYKSINLPHRVTNWSTIRDYTLFIRVLKSCRTEPKKKRVGWNLTFLFSTNTAISETRKKRVMKKLKTKTEMLRRNDPVIKSAEAGRESMVGRICNRGRFWAGSERERELWVVRVESWQSDKMW